MLVCVGAALTALYAYATYRIPLYEHFPSAGVSLDWISMLGPGRREPAVAYIVLTSAASVFYLVALLVAWQWREHVPRWLWVAFPALFVLALLLMYPPTAVDMFHYHADARTLWIFGLNPLVVPPSETGYHIGISWAEQPSPYGPIWSVLTGLLAPLMIWGDHGLATLIGLKLLAGASFGACTYLIWRIVQITLPGREWLALVLFAWNPFVLLRVVGNGHNDLTMMAFALLALLLAYHRLWALVFLMLALSVLIKYSTALLGPPLLLYAWMQVEGTPRERVRTLAPAMLVGAGMVVFAFLPFWAGAETFATVRGQADQTITSIADVLREHWRESMGDAQALSTAQWVTTLAFLAIAAPVTWHARRGYDALLVACFALTFLYLVIAAAWFRPWYLLWPVALLALRPTGWNVALLVTISLCNLFPDPVEQYRYDWGTPTLLEARLWPVVVQFGLPLLVWGAALVLANSEVRATFGLTASTGAGREEDKPGVADEVPRHGGSEGERLHEVQGDRIVGIEQHEEHAKGGVVDEQAEQ